MAVGMNPKKFNIQLNNSGGGAAGVKNTVAQSLKTATRSNEINPATVNTRTSSLNAPCLYGVGAARTKTGSGVHHNAKAFYSNDNFFALQQSNQGVHFAMNSGMSNLCGHVHGANNNKMSTLEKIAMLTAVTGTVTAGILGALNAGKSTQTSGTNNSQKMAESDQAFNYDSSKFKLTGELQKAGTFGEMKGIEVEEEIDVQLELNVSSYIPDEYIEDSNQKIEIYQAIALCKNEEELKDITDSIIDRYGNMPKEIEKLIDIARIRNMCREKNIIKISQKTNKVIFYFDEKKFDFKVVDELIKKYGMRIKFSPSKNPYVTYLLKDVNDILKEIKEFLSNT